MMIARAVILQPQMLTPVHVLTLSMTEILTQALVLIILFIQIIKAVFYYLYNSVINSV